METVEEMFFLDEGEIGGLEYFAFGEGNVFELVVGDVEDAFY